ncbi:MFS transporter [Halomonas binhaiensis]|uniref:MFS transporter n=1 Tax=Halomonas binhaiensis TaxID=2562282 RepID=A0A5C1N992_9GAMM|nr:MFS transporter [Halomonas binhaiensis]QEM80292.1 MFS transporter [Halomonas binhaiensis]
MSELTQRVEPAWGAVFSMTLGVLGLVTAEFLPASLLTPMAADLGVTEGMTGQAVTVTAAIALVTSLLISSVTRSIDRRYVLLGFSTLLIASNLMVAFASNMTELLLARVLLGLALGGFWTMSIATMMRLVPDDLVPRALSIMFSGVSVATIAAAPLGSYLGDIVGWRSVFQMAAGLGVIALAVQFMTLPRMAGQALGLGMLTGHFAFFTYIRPFLEIVTGVGVNGVAGILFGFGFANFLGNYLGGWMIERNLRMTMIAMPLVMGVLGLSLVSTGSAPVLDALMVALWGMAFGAIPVAWSTWLTRTVPDEAESASGLLVAAINTAIASGAAMGGAIFDISGINNVFLASGGILLLAAVLILKGVRDAEVPGRSSPQGL